MRRSVRDLSWLCPKAEMLVLPIALPTGAIAVLAPVPYWQLPAYEVIRSRLQHWNDPYFGDLAADDRAWAMLQQLINQLPRLDTPGQTGFVLGEEWLFLESFLSDVETLHEVSPIEPADSEATPIPSSGDPRADLLADLSFEHGSESALALLKANDLNTLNHVIKRYNELARDPKEREQEELAIDYADWKKDNQASYRKSLGLPVINRGNPNRQLSESRASGAVASASIAT